MKSHLSRFTCRTFDLSHIDYKKAANFQRRQACFTPKLASTNSRQRFAIGPNSPFGSNNHKVQTVSYRRCFQAGMATTSESTKSNERILSLNELETKLRDLLLDAARYMNPGNPSELRFTGGWVRDKLLGVSSHDIDVAINNMTGYQFALQLKQYLDETGHKKGNPLEGDIYVSSEQGSDSKSDTFGTIAKIEANPEKSKHLETVTTKVFGLDIDFVNLRKETYTDDSRNPTMEFGTPEEDALRRDATINALFYNLQSSKVEDFTNSGLKDLQLHVIRTPLEPYQTFKDDPLRVLRLIRFASRLQYSMDPATKEAMYDDTIKDALKLKISRERVGVELDKMLKGPNPRLALLLIDELDLYTTIFSDPTRDHSFRPDTKDWPSYFNCVANLFETSGSPIVNILFPHESERYLAWLLSAFVPFADAPAFPTNQGKPLPPVAAMVAREGIKATNKICDMITSSVRNFGEIIKIKDQFIRKDQNSAKDVDPVGRDVLGMAIRQWGPSWRNQAFFALLIDYGRSHRDVLQEWNKFLEYIRDKELLDVVDLKPLINGNAIAKALNTKPGPWMKDALEVVMAWQLRNPETATEENAVQAVREHQQMRNQNGDTESRSQESLQSQGELVADLVNAFLLLTIRPLFAKTAQAHADQITPQGRKIERASARKGPNPRNRDESEDEHIMRPWKNEKHLYSIDLLEWVVRNLDHKQAEKQWPLLIPPILTLLDDIDAKFKARGCVILQRLLKTAPASLLKRTGLADVFEQALSPSLSYLPSLTPESDAIRILNSAYPALFALILAKASFLSSPKEKQSYQAKALTEILHKHLLSSFAHIAPSPATVTLQYPLLTASLITQLNTVIKYLKLDTIPQLQYIVPLLAELMTTPFATSSTEGLNVLKAALDAMQYVIACSWVRIARWRVEVLSPCCDAWLALLQEEESLTTEQLTRVSTQEAQRLEMIAQIRSSLQICTAMLVRAVEATSETPSGESAEGLGRGVTDDSINIRQEIAELVNANDRLRELFVEPPSEDTDK